MVVFLGGLRASRRGHQGDCQERSVSGSGLGTWVCAVCEHFMEPHTYNLCLLSDKKVKREINRSILRYEQSKHKISKCFAIIEPLLVLLNY